MTRTRKLLILALFFFVMGLTSAYDPLWNLTQGRIEPGWVGETYMMVFPFLGTGAVHTYHFFSCLSLIAAVWSSGPKETR